MSDSTRLLGFETLTTGDLRSKSDSGRSPVRLLEFDVRRGVSSKPAPIAASDDVRCSSLLLARVENAGMSSRGRLRNAAAMLAVDERTRPLSRWSSSCSAKASSISMFAP